MAVSEVVILKEQLNYAFSHRSSMIAPRFCNNISILKIRFSYQGGIPKTVTLHWKRILSLRHAAIFQNCLRRDWFPRKPLTFTQSATNQGLFLKQFRGRGLGKEGGGEEIVEHCLGKFKVSGNGETIWREEIPTRFRSPEKHSLINKLIKLMFENLLKV